MKVSHLEYVVLCLIDRCKIRTINEDGDFVGGGFIFYNIKTNI